MRIYWFNPIRIATRSTQNVQRFLHFTDCGSHDEPSIRFKDFQLVSNIRNPYSRFVSIFYFNSPNEYKSPEVFKLYCEKKIWEEKNIKNKPDLQLSLSNIFEKHQMIPSYLVKLENIYSDIINLPFVKDKIDTNFLKTMELNIKRNEYSQEYERVVSWQEHYDEKTANLVFEFLEKDFILGNYKKDSWKNGTS